MAKKTKSRTAEPPAPEKTSHDIDETFNDSEDDFYIGRDKILLDEGPVSKRQCRVAEQGYFSLQLVVLC